MSYYIKFPILRQPRRSAVAFGEAPAIPFLPPQPPAPTADLPEAEWRRRMLLAQEGFVVEAQKFRAQDKIARIGQISATLAIPLAAAVWRAIFHWRSRSSGTE